MSHEHVAGTSEPLYPTLLISDVAQDVSNYPWEAMDWAQGLYDRGMAWYERAGLAERDPGRADYLATRAVWNALATPIIYGGEQALLEEMLPRIQKGLRLASSVMVSSHTFDTEFSQPYDGEDLTVLRTMAAYSSDAMGRFMDRLTTSPSQWYFPAWQAFVEWHPRFCALEQQHKRRPGNRPSNRPPQQREGDPLAAAMQLTVDSNETVWSILKRAFNHFPEWGEDWEQNPKAGLLSIMDELERPASTKDTLVAHYLNRYREASREKCPLTHGRLPFGRGGIWRLPRLRDGKQRPTGFCPAISFERGHYPDWRARTEALYDQAHQDIGRPRHLILPYGTSTAVGIRNRLVGYAALEIKAA